MNTKIRSSRDGEFGGLLDDLKADLFQIGEEFTTIFIHYLFLTIFLCFLWFSVNIAMTFMRNIFFSRLSSTSVWHTGLITVFSISLTSAYIGLLIMKK